MPQLKRPPIVPDLHQAGHLTEAEDGMRPALFMTSPSEISSGQHLLAIEINALRVAEIYALHRECEFWRQHCRLLEAVAESDGIRKRPASFSRRYVRVVAATPQASPPAPASRVRKHLPLAPGYGPATPVSAYLGSGNNGFGRLMATKKYGKLRAVRPPRPEFTANEIGSKAILREPRSVKKQILISDIRKQNT